MHREPNSKGNPADLDEVLADYMRRVDGGEHVDQQALVAAHPELATQLREYFSQAVAVERFVVGATPLGSDVAATVEHTPGRKASRGLQICCPHCSNFVEVVTDTPYEEICCSTCGSTFSLVEREEATRMSAPLKSIGRFDLISRLGVGGFGTVWKARDRDLDRTVAVKIPRRGQLGGAEIDQFFREARAAAQLRHRNIVQVHEVGREQETLFIVSDLVRGVTLADWLTGKRVNMKEVVELCIPIAAALHHAHEQGVVHRDLKPSNIMIDEESQPLLTDFGLAKREMGEVTMTVDGQILGTPAYMSPEQAGGEGHWTDRRTDIYSFGVILFELLTGELPFRGNAQMQVHQRLTEDPPEPRKLNPHISRDLATICWKCLEREPGRRYSTAAEVEEEFKRVQRGEPILARPLSRIARGVRWAQRKPLVATTAALTIFLGIFGPVAAALIYYQNKDLQIRYREREQLISNSHVEASQLKGKVSVLEKELAVWEGRAKPSEFWPPQKKPPRQLLVADLFEHADKTLAASLRDSKFDAESKARGYLALAMMAAAMDNRAQAAEYYGLARDELLELVKQHPDDASYARAIGACQTQLASLNKDGDQAQVAKDYDTARRTFASLAADHKGDAVSQIELLEAELNSAVASGFESGQQSLLQVDRIKDVLRGQWPSEPAALYQLACFLTRQDPMLTSSDKVGKATAGEAASPTSR